MSRLTVEIHWCDKNYACVYDYPGFGCVAVTNKTLEGLKHDFLESLHWHIESSVEDGDFVPDFLRSDFSVDFVLATSALLRHAERFTTMAAISRATGINQRLLSNYASEVKTPRPAQREKIVAGLHEIGKQFLAMC